METTKTLFAQVTQELADSFTLGKRDDGKRFCKVKDDAPSWVQDADVCMDAHQALDSRMPDDWTYEKIAGFAESLSGYNIDDECDAEDYLAEIADGMVDIYTNELYEWLKFSYNRDIVEEAREEMGSGDTLDDDIMRGQFFAIERIGQSLINSIQAEVEAREV